MKLKRNVNRLNLMNNKTSAVERRKKKRRLQITLFFLSLTLIITALAFTVSKIGQSQDNRQQAWDGSDPYNGGVPPQESDDGPTPEECTSLPVPEGCSDYLDNCKGCREAGVGCEGCGAYNDLADKCSGISGILGSGGDDCEIIESLEDKVGEEIEIADGITAADCTSLPVPEGCSDYLNNCKNCYGGSIGCEGCGAYNDLADECSGISGLFGGGGDDCKIIDYLNGDYEPIVTEAPPKEVPSTMTSATPTPTEVPSKITSENSITSENAITSENTQTKASNTSLREKTKIFLLNLIN